MHFRCLRAAVGSVFLALACSGCGGDKKVKITGKLLKDGHPMIVSMETYVTLSFIPVFDAEDKAQASKVTSHSAKFDQTTGTYAIELPSGTYRTMLVISLPPDPKKPGQLGPTRTIKSDKQHELKKIQELDIEVPPQ